MTNEQLIAYAAGDLSGDPAREVAAYLTGNAAARDMVERYRAVRAIGRTDDTVAPSAAALASARGAFRQWAAAHRPTLADWLRDLARVALACVFDSRMQPGLVGLRGAADTLEMTFETPAGDVDLEVHADGAARRICGQISPAPATPAEVLLSPAGSTNEVARITADASGAFVLTAPAGRYDLYVRHTDSLWQAADLDLT